MSAHAAHAAAAEQRRKREEEEELTPYTQQDLSQDWEFKILRSSFSQFRRNSYLEKVLHEERRAGWTLVEKFDNSRIRLKRPAQARHLDGKLDFDPYRTYVGASQEKVALFVVLAFTAILLGIIFLVAKH